MQGRLHSTERYAGKDRDLTVAESFDVGEMNNHPVPVRQCPQCSGQIRVQAAEYFKPLRSRKRLPECVLQEFVGIWRLPVRPECRWSDYRHSRFIGA